jgi:hypothetical protein
MIRRRQHFAPRHAVRAFVTGPRDPEGREKALRQARANARHFGTMYAVWRDTNGNWRVDRTSNAGDEANWIAVVGPTGHVDYRERQGGGAAEARQSPHVSARSTEIDEAVASWNRGDAYRDGTLRVLIDARLVTYTSGGWMPTEAGVRRGLSPTHYRENDDEGPHSWKPSVEERDHHVAGRSRAITYALHMQSRGYSYTPSEWRVRARYGARGYGAPTDANLEQHIRAFEASTQPGGANAHLGPTTISRAWIVDQRSGFTVAGYDADMFQVIEPRGSAHRRPARAPSRHRTRGRRR